MQRSILFLLCLISLIASVSGYALLVDCSESVQVGTPLKCTVNSDFPVGARFNIIFFQAQNVKTEVSRQLITIRENKSTQYFLFDTKGLPGGNYKVESEYMQPDPRLISDTITTQTVKLIDNGYSLYVDCTNQVIAGTPIKCNIDSDLPGTATFFVELYSPSSQRIAQQQVFMIDGQTKQLKFFDTAGLANGNYSINTRLRIDGTIFRNDSRFGNTVIITSPQFTTTPSSPPTLMTTASIQIPTPSLTLIAPVPSTVQTTTVPTTLISASPTKSVNQLLEEQNKKIDEQNRLITEQNKKMESQNDLLSQILSKIKSIFGWN